MSSNSPSGIDVRALYEKYGRAIYRRCQYFLRDDAEAEDAMHDVFLKLVDRHAEFRGQSSPLTWLIRITTNHCLNRLRARNAPWRRKYQTAVQTMAEHSPDPSDPVTQRDMVHHLLSKMDRKTQQAAVFVWVDEMTQEDAARAAGCSVPTLRKRLQRFLELARKTLRQDPAALRLLEHPGDPPPSDQLLK